MKIRGFKILDFGTRYKEVIVKRKTISLIEVNDQWLARSYNDKGYAVSAKHETKDIAINQCIDKCLTQIKKYKGFVLIPRPYPDIELAENTIIWWEKGYKNKKDVHYKCEALINGSVTDAVGNTLEDALFDLFVWQNL